jgi:hypothetical protein
MFSSDILWSKSQVKDGEEAQLYHKKGMEQQASYLIKGSS